MNAILASLWPYLIALGGILAAFVTRWWTKQQSAKAVAQAKADTATQTRQDVAAESAVAAQQAEASARVVAVQADARAASIAAQGDDALNAELARKGGLRD